MIARLHRWRAGLIGALLALMPLIVAGGLAPQPTIEITPVQKLAILLDQPGALCHGSSEGDRQDRPGRHDHALDCLLCPFCAAIHSNTALRGDGPSLPLRRAGPIAIAVAAPASILVPPSPVMAARPRGPPNFG